MHHEEVQFIEFVLFDKGVDHVSDDDVEIHITVQGRQQFGESCGRSLDVLLGEYDQQCVLVGEVLMQRTYRDVGLVGDVIGGVNGSCLERSPVSGEGVDGSGGRGPVRTFAIGAGSPG